MPTKAHGPLQEDYRRALAAAKRAGAKSVAIVIGRSTIVIGLEGDYMDKLAQGQPPAPDAKAPGKEDFKLNW